MNMTPEQCEEYIRGQINSALTDCLNSAQPIYHSETGWKLLAECAQRHFEKYGLPSGWIPGNTKIE
jgi:hypothetical protein